MLKLRSLSVKCKLNNGSGHLIFGLRRDIDTMVDNKARPKLEGSMCAASGTSMGIWKMRTSDEPSTPEC